MAAAKLKVTRRGLLDALTKDLSDIPHDVLLLLAYDRQPCDFYKNGYFTLSRERLKELVQEVVDDGVYVTWERLAEQRKEELAILKKSKSL